MPWEGEPKWTGEIGKSFGGVIGKFFPVTVDGPFVIAIEGSSDLFFMLFSTVEKLKDTTEKFLAKLGESDRPYSWERVLQTDLIDGLIDCKVRLMCDPEVIDDHHTKWLEIVRENDLYKYVQSSSKKD